MNTILIAAPTVIEAISKVGEFTEALDKGTEYMMLGQPVLAPASSVVTKDMLQQDEWSWIESPEQIVVYCVLAIR